MTHIIYSQLPLTDSFGLPLRINGMHRTQSDLMRIWTFYLLQFNHTGFDLLSRNAPINVELGGRHSMGWGLALRYRWGIWPILFSWGRGYLNLSSPDMGIFDHWLRRKKLIPTRHFSLHSCTVQSGNQEGQRWGWKQVKVEWIWLCCLHILFYLGNLTTTNFLKKFPPLAPPPPPPGFTLISA